MSDPIEELRKELLSKMNQIERESGGFSNIGMTSEYWDYLKQYRTLEAQNVRPRAENTNPTSK